MKITATIITLNEGKDLEKCLKSLVGLVDEIVLVDSGSTDKTLDIAKKYKAKIFTRKFDNYANQKNFAANKASNDWILSIDGDEEISQGLYSEIKMLNENGVSGYSIPRKNIIFGKFIKYTRWQPELDRHIWLYKKSQGKMMGEVHEEIEIKGKIQKLKNPKIHYQYENVKQFLDMMNKYSNLDKKWVNPIYNFLVRYFYRLGFLDGVRGFVLSYLTSIYQIEVWVKNWEKKQ